jgi:hypothetical protein
LSGWEDLAEARIREWLARPEDERRRGLPPLEPGTPLEVQLFRDARVLDRLAAAAQDPGEASRLTRAADDLMLRLRVLLEGSGRPLAARHFAAQRRAGDPGA